MAIPAATALVLALAAFAHSPVLRAGLLSFDYAGLLGEMPGPLARAWSRASLALWGLPLPGRGALGLRLEQLLGLSALALALRIVVARLLEPRLGSRAARSAARCAALFLLVHPRAPQLIAELAARPELAGWTLGLWSVALFLVGRQEHRDVLTSASVVLLLAAGLASAAAVPLVLVLAGAEFACVRRHRKRSLRWRTAATTAAVFGAAALLPLWLVGRSAGAAESSGSWEGARTTGATLARIVLPAASESSPVQGLAAGLLWLAALWPAFHAARHAPRLWSGMLGVWSLAAVATGGWCSLAGGGELPLLTVFCAGLGVTVTAQTAPRWLARVGSIALGLAVLAHVQTRPWLGEARLEGRLWQELEPIARASTAPVLVVDAPTAGGLPRRRELGWLFHPRLVEPLGATPGPFTPGRVRALSAAAFLTLASSPALAEERRLGTRVVVDGAALGRPAGWHAVGLAPAKGSAVEERTWRALTYTPPEALDPLDWEFARFVADLAGMPGQIEQLGWDGGDGARGVALGAVFERGGRRVAEFDLSASLAWRLSGTIRTLRVEKGVRAIERSELHGRLPELAGVGTPAVEGEDWRFALPSEDGEPGGSYLVSLLALADLELLALPLEREEGGLRARGAQGFVARKARRDGDVVWLLDYRIGPRTLQRARGSAP